MTDLAAHWQQEADARAARAARAVAAGKATADQAAQDAALCGIISDWIARGFPQPDRSVLGDAGMNAHFDAAEAVRKIAHRAIVDWQKDVPAARAAFPDAAAQHAHALSLRTIANHASTAICAVHYGCWWAVEWDRAGRPHNFTPAEPMPLRWRIPI